MARDGDIEGPHDAWSCGQVTRTRGKAEHTSHQPCIPPLRLPVIVPSRQRPLDQSQSHSLSTDGRLWNFFRMSSHYSRRSGIDSGLLATCLPVPGLARRLHTTTTLPRTCPTPFFGRVLVFSRNSSLSLLHQNFHFSALFSVHGAIDTIEIGIPTPHGVSLSGANWLHPGTYLHSAPILRNIPGRTSHVAGNRDLRTTGCHRVAAVHTPSLLLFLLYTQTGFFLHGPHSSRIL
jgi:hypothetical protein